MSVAVADDTRVGLVLAGGSARGAYEASVLSVLLPVLERRGERPRIFAGTSVGAINVASVAATRHLDADEAVELALERWREVDRAAVIDRSSRASSRSRRCAMRARSSPCPACGCRACSIQRRSERNLRRWIDSPQLHRNVDRGVVECLAVVATATRTGRAVAFVEGALGLPAHRSHVIDYVPARLDEVHVRASAAIRCCSRPCASTSRHRRAGGTSRALDADPGPGQPWQLGPLDAVRESVPKLHA